MMMFKRFYVIGFAYTFLAASALTALPDAAYAACTSPAGPAGRIEYTSTGGEEVFKYCDGTDWIPWAGEPVTGIPAPLYSSALGANSVLELHLKAVNGATDEQCLTYETTTGDFEWQACGGGGTPAGSDRQLQFNNGGSFGADANLVFSSTNVLSLTGQGFEAKGTAPYVMLSNNAKAGLGVMTNSADKWTADTFNIGLSSGNNFLAGRFSSSSGYYVGTIVPKGDSYTAFFGGTWNPYNYSADTGGLAGLYVRDGVTRLYAYGEYSVQINGPYGTVQAMDASDTANIGPTLGLVRARTGTGPATAVQVGDTLGSVVFRGRNSAGGTPGNPVASISAIVDNGTVGLTTIPSKLTFWTSLDGQPESEKLTILGNGNVGIGDTSPETSLDVVGSVSFDSDISPTSIGANQNDYAPTGHATASSMRLTATAPYNITGLQGGADGRILTLFNIGTNTITLKAEDATSTAANRFDIGSDIALAADQAAVLMYDATSSRWRAMARPGSGGAAGGDTQVFTANGTWTKPSGVNICRVKLWGAGGGGGGAQSAAGEFAGGGGGGAFFSELVFASVLGATESVVIGTGGAGGTTAGTVGSAGGNTTFDTFTAYGGGGGSGDGPTTGGGGGGGWASVGSVGAALGGTGGGSGADPFVGGNGGGGETAGRGEGGAGRGGGGGGGGNSGGSGAPGGSSTYGGGGGGGGRTGSAAAGGTSLMGGGAGGAGGLNSVGQPGNAPGGGGGGAANTSGTARVGGTGARGEAQIECW